MNLPLITVEYLLDENIDHYLVERQALQDICALTGGLMFFIFGITKLCVGQLTEASFMRKIIKRVFIFDDLTISAESRSNKVVTYTTETKRSLGNDEEAGP